MPSTSFSVVIPTRNRPYTLRYTLQTCLHQSYDNYEIIISDNSTNEDTYRVVAEFNSPRIKYVRTPRSLAMSKNFDHGISYANNEYVIVIGDDDGLLPDSLVALDRQIQEKPGFKAYRWDLVWYFWPNSNNLSQRNKITIPQGVEDRVMHCNPTVSEVLNYELYYMFLPMLYHSAIHRDLLRELKEKTGAFCQSRSPDLYTGFALAYLAQTWLYCGESFSIMGSSGSSTGWATMTNQEAIVQDFDSTNKDDGIDWHPNVPAIPSLMCYLMDSFRIAKDALFPYDDNLAYDPKESLINVVATAEGYLTKEYLSQAIRKAYIEREPETLQWAESVLFPNIDVIRADLGGKLLPSNFLTRWASTLEVKEQLGIRHIFGLFPHLGNVRPVQNRTRKNLEQTRYPTPPGDSANNNQLTASF